MKNNYLIAKIIALAVVLPCLLFLNSKVVSASIPVGDDASQTIPGGGTGNESSSSTESGGGSESSGIPTRQKDNADAIYSKIINPAIIVLSGAVVLAVVASVVVAGIQYSAASGNSAQVAAAKNRIAVAVVVLILYTFGFALLQWLIPGGIGQ